MTLQTAPPEPSAYARLSAALERRECYPHPTADEIVRIDTHISSVYLTGLYAYKLKKPVDLGFLDFSRVDKRRYYCEEEVRLNRRLAPDLYLDVVEIRGSIDEPRIGGAGAIVDYAVRMRQFPREALASLVLARNELTAGLIGDLADRIAAFHAGAKRAVSPQHCGHPQSLLAAAMQNFDQMAALRPAPSSAPLLARLRHWTEREYLLRYDAFQVRSTCGRVRECHGDLHLGNLALLDGKLVPFDCIEFSAALRWIDVFSEVAFLVMDLLDRNASTLAWLFLNRYLEATADYAGLTVLRFYLVYRALVRAKVHLLRAGQTGLRSAEEERLKAASEHYVVLAQRLAACETPTIIVMHGLSATGKTTIATALSQAIGAIHVRSDIERKRLHGLKPLERSGSALESGLYGESATIATYRRLEELASIAVGAGYPVILDAAYLQRARRQDVRTLADRLGARLLLVSLAADPEMLRERILKRAAAANDASEATLAVLEHQIATEDPVAAEEGLRIVTLEAAGCQIADAVDRVRCALAACRVSRQAGRADDDCTPCATHEAVVASAP